MERNVYQFKYPSKRMVTYGSRGMVATAEPLAAQSGLDILKRGGNAIDAAVAAAACLTVTEPVSNGIGGDMFALVWHQGELHGLNASGPSPGGISACLLRDKGYAEMPFYGWIPVTVPGAPKGWAALTKRFGKLSLLENLEPAIRYAKEGYAVGPVISREWQKAYHVYSDCTEKKAVQGWFDTFAPNGRTPLPGEVRTLPDHGNTLEMIGRTNSADFYNGSLAEKIDAFSKETGGYLRMEDLAAYEAEWVEPIRASYRGYDVWEIPPNGHGIVALMALNIASGFDFPERDCIDTIHRQIEAMKLAYADGAAYIADPVSMTTSVEAMLAPAYGAKRRGLITDQAMLPYPGKPEAHGTVYLATADGEGNMVSLIQSNYKGFGSGVVVPGTGIALHDRGSNFVLEEGHPNCLAPGKKPYHTIIPGFLSKDGSAVGPFGVMGGFMQPQGHMQVVMNLIDFNLNPQQALDAPRWRWIEGKKVELEESVPEALANELRLRGHDITIQRDPKEFGRGQIILRTKEGTLCGGTEPRAGGVVAAW